MIVDCTEQLLRVQAGDSPPLIERAFHASVDTSCPVESFK